MKNKFLKTFILFSLLAAGASAQPGHKLLPAEQEIPLNYGADRLGKRYDADMQKFRDNRLGAFIHWGLYAIPGGEWNGKVYPGAAEWLKSWAKVPSGEWLELMKQWNAILALVCAVSRAARLRCRQTAGISRGRARCLHCAFRKRRGSLSCP